ncbi:MAG: hypothetical protein JEY71_12370 [Sphaerochaeta sp.]|nr:hypothetical protein [Sphaerochaeta sp.]
MGDEQFKAETAYQVSLSLFEGLLHSGLLSEEEFTRARELLLTRYNPPLGRLFSEFG